MARSGLPLWPESIATMGSIYTSTASTKCRRAIFPVHRSSEIMESTSGEIYAATMDSGLLLFRESENRFERVELDSDPNEYGSRLTTAYSSSAGELWMGYENGDVVRYSPASSAVSSIRFNDGQKITGLGETHSGEILAASANGDIFGVSVDLDSSRAIPLTQSCLDKFSELGEITAAAKIYFGWRPEATDPYCWT